MMEENNQWKKGGRGGKAVDMDAMLQVAKKMKRKRRKKKAVRPAEMVEMML